MFVGVVVTRAATSVPRLHLLPHGAGRAGIFYGVNSVPDPDAVLQDLGDEFVEALVESVEAARADLDAFRRRPHPPVCAKVVSWP